MNITNDARFSGSLAGAKRLLGAESRYAVAPVHTRFEAVQWFVWDAERADDVTGLASVIRQAESEEEAVSGLPT